MFGTKKRLEEEDKVKMTALGAVVMPPPPPTESVKELYKLIKHLDEWESYGNKDLAYEMWIIISNRAKLRAEAIKKS